MNRRFLSAERKEHLSDLGEQVAEDYAPDSVIAPEVIIDALGITKSFGDYGNTFDGMIECRSSRFHIFCNVERTSGRRSARTRFTLCHELGHYFIDEHRQALLEGRGQHPSRCEFESKNLVEQEADHFASALLLPPSRFSRAARSAKRGLPGILGLAKGFDASITATAVRYVQENLVSCVAIKWGPDGYAWKWLSQQAREGGYRKTIESLSKIPKGSATADALAEEQLPPSGFFEKGSTASFWFPFVSDSGHQNTLLIEQAVPLGQFGVLTLLFPEKDALR